MNRTNRRWLVFAPVLLVVGAGAQAAASAPPGTEAATPSEPAAPTALEEPAPRLVVSDGVAGRVEVIDLLSGQSVGAPIETGGVSTLYTDGRFVFATASDDNAVTVVDGGSWVEEHGDHVHAFATEPSVVGTIEGPSPVHTVANDDHVLVFFDGDGTIAAINTDELPESGAEPELTIVTAGPHHGVAVAIDGHLVVSVPGPTAEDLPTGVEIRHGAEEVEAEFPEDCPEMHGEAAFEDGVLFACDDGALWVSRGEGGWTAEKVAWPAAASGEARTWSFAHTHGVPLVAGVAGDGLVTVDVHTGTATRFESPGDVLALAVAEGGSALLAVTRDGVAHLIDSASGEVTATAPLVTAVAEDVASYSPESPKITIDESRAYVSDPATGTVVEVVTSDGLRTARTFDLGVAPASLVIVGSGS
jgi:hypothetical protein